MDEAQLRTHVKKLLDWHDAHATFDDAVEGIPPELRGKQPQGLPYSPWQLLEHMRLAQWDILDFCVNSDYTEGKFPDDYWPRDIAPQGGEWDESVKRFKADRNQLRKLADTADLGGKVPAGTGQTFLRELLLVADHNAYHTGELIVVRRLLGCWG